MPSDPKRTRALPPLIALRAFEAVGASGSVKAAAETLAVSPTVVSRHLANLETRLNAKLVEPKGRSLALTAAGERYHAEIAKAFDLIAAATEDLARPQKAPLKLWCWPGLAVTRLLPRLPELEARLPGFSVHLHPSIAEPDLKGGEADAVISYRTQATMPRAGIIERELARPRVMPVASPALIDRLGGDARRLDLIFEAPWLHEVSSDEWRAWLIAAGLPVDGRAEKRLEGPRLWHAHLAIGAAKLGQGIALANELLAADDFAEGRLIEIGQTEVRLGVYDLAVRADTADSEPMRALVDWLSEALRLS